MHPNENNNENSLQTLWHSTAHVLAQAVKRLFPGTLLSIGPTIAEGFYYDFDPKEPFVFEHLSLIEEEMKKIVKESLPIKRFVKTKEEAFEIYKLRNEIYKLAILDDINDSEVSFYQQGEFLDLCRGPHLENTNEIKFFKLLTTTGAYFKGDVKNKMLSRIYGISYYTKKELDDFFKRKEEAKERDHNKLGRELEIFTTVDVIGKGLPILLPKGAKIIQLLQRFIEDEEEKRGYQLTKTPLIAKNDLFKISGHWQHYRQDMIVTEDEKFALRPMTCPFQFQVYLNKLRSYKELPMRLSETSTCFRNEDSGEMHGLIRLKQFTISDAHIICRLEQLRQEFEDCLNFANFCLETIGLKEDVYYRFSKWDPDNREKYIGTTEEWEYSQTKMEQILKQLNIQYFSAENEAAFYGPKLDIQIKNVHGKEDTLITIQIDFQLSKKFGMYYINERGEKETPYIIHRTSIGCYERTLALLIEKFKGTFPLWLAPHQVVILPIDCEKHLDYSKGVLKALNDNLVKRVTIDDNSEKISYKIRQYQKQKIPCIVIVGDDEVQNNTISLRRNNNSTVFSISKFVESLREEIENKK